MRPLLSCVWLAGLAMVATGCASGNVNTMAADAKDLEPAPKVKKMIAMDIVSRMERDFFHFESNADNVAKIMSDCNYVRACLKGNDTIQVIVKINWFADGRFGIPKGHNYVRGAQDNGQFYVYTIQNDRPVFLGAIEGNDWFVLAATSDGFADIQANEHMSCDSFVMNHYRYSTGQYRLVSSVLRKVDED